MSVKTVVRIVRAKGFRGLFRTILKKLFPSNNPYFAWESRNLLKCTAGDENITKFEDCRYQVIKCPIANHQRLIGLNGMTGHSIKKAVDHHENCWIAKKEDLIVGYVWISSKRQQIMSDTGYYFPVNIEQGAYWWRDLYILPEHRGQRLVELLFSGWVKSFNEAKRETLYTEVSPDNITSIKVHGKLGFKEFCRLRMICFIGMRLYFLTTQEKYRLKYRFCPHWLY